MKKIIARLIDFGDFLKPSPKEIPNGENVLPLYPSGLGWCGITIDGDIVGTDGEKPLELEKETESILINVALIQGAKKYPELSSLLPVRKENDLTCSYCNGSGQHLLADKVDILCYCGGVGWIPN